MESGFPALFFLTFIFPLSACCDFQHIWAVPRNGLEQEVLDGEADCFRWQYKLYKFQAQIWVGPGSDFLFLLNIGNDYETLKG